MRDRGIPISIIAALNCLYTLWDMCSLIVLCIFDSVFSFVYVRLDVRLRVVHFGICVL